MGIYERSYYRDENELNLTPSWNQRSAVSTLIIANVAVFVANILLSQKRFEGDYQGVVNEFLMLYDSDLSKPLYWWRMFTYAFTHDATGVGHILFNMLGLYFLGRSVEDRYGRAEFYRIYLVAVLVCGFGWVLKQQVFGAVEQKSVLLGASGAVLCIEMLFVFNFPLARVYLLVFPVPAWVLGVLMILINLTSGPSTGVAFDVHLIGILFAAAYFYFRWSFGFMGDLAGNWRRWSRKLTGPKLKIHTEALSSNEADEADRILSKIHEFGQESLTVKEKKFLEKYSRSVRAKKQQQ
jgi:membrane associated rhomboid family serine protease